MFNPDYFTFWQNANFAIAASLLIASVILFHFNLTRASIWLLAIGTLALGYFIIGLDPFLILWDEQYHALVAKNMAKNPIVPKLYADPVLPYYFGDWSGNYIWLHKQPLFLWEMAASIKIFGTNEIAIRLPGVISHTAATIMIYRMGKISHSDAAGFYGALFFAVAFYQLELMAGRFTTDHNDISFLFYVTASFWAWFEYQRSKKPKYLILIGVFAGGAVLVKWLTGLVVFAGWFLSIAFSADRKFRNLNPLLKAILVAVLVFLPWQIYILLQFPNEANHEFTNNTLHFFEVVEGHGGNLFYHFDVMKDIYGSGDLIRILLIFGLVVLSFGIKKLRYNVMVISAVVIIYLFYTLAATKMPSFTILVSPFLYMGFGAICAGFFNLVSLAKAPKILMALTKTGIIVLVAFFILKLDKIENNHSTKDPYNNYARQIELKQMMFNDSIRSNLGNEKYVVFNAAIRHNGHISTMFYTDYIAYPGIPDTESLNIAKKSNYNLAIRDEGNLPQFIIDDVQVKKVRFE